MRSRLILLGLIQMALSSISCSSVTDRTIVNNNQINVATDDLHGIKRINRNLSDYVRDLTHELVSNITHVQPNSVFATSSFVYVDGDFLSTPTFAKQIQESFAYEFHKVGQPIIEFKSTGFIRVLPEGDFALSRDYTELKSSQPIDYILVGTLTDLRDGVQVNAKVIGTSSHAIVAVAQVIIPRNVVNNIIPTARRGQSIKLIN
ncbi:MAG: FlgO family outer membrane protein [Colwellia sp.]